MDFPASGQTQADSNYGHENQMGIVFFAGEYDFLLGFDASARPFSKCGRGARTAAFESPQPRQTV